MASSLPPTKLRVAAVGATRGVSLIKNYWHPLGEIQPVAICDLNHNLASEQAALLAKDSAADVRVFTNLQDMLAWGQFDIVIVASSDATHFDIASRVLHAGYHCFVEKPMTTSIEDARQLVACWQRSGKIAVVGHEFRYTASVRAAKTHIDNGVIGQPRLAITIDSCGRMGSYWRRHRWRTSQKPANNSLTLQKAIHQLDVQTYLMGSRARSVFATGNQDHFGGDKPSDLTCDECDIAHQCMYSADRVRINGHPNPKSTQDRICVYTDDVDLDDNKIVAIDYENGSRGSYVECFFTPDYKVEHTIIGDLGRIIIRIFNGNPYQEVEISRIGSAQYERTLHPGFGGHGGGDDNLAKAFLQAVRTGQQIQPDLLDGYHAVALAQSIDRSIHTCMPEPVPDC